MIIIKTKMKNHPVFGDKEVYRIYDEKKERYRLGVYTTERRAKEVLNKINE